MILRALIGLLALLSLMALALAANTYRQGSTQLAVQALPVLAVDREGAAQSLAAAVRAKTVSGLLDPAGTAAAFGALHAHLQQRYPRTHAQLPLEVFGERTLVFTWKGSEAGLEPIAVMSHQDVVPIAPGTERLWQQPPFEGRIEGGFVWGRGAWDDKGNLIAQLEALEMLLQAGFAPRRTVYFIFGHDEEVRGAQGALKVAEAFQQRGIRRKRGAGRRQGSLPATGRAPCQRR